MIYNYWSSTRNVNCHKLISFFFFLVAIVTDGSDKKKSHQRPINLENRKNRSRSGSNKYLKKKPAWYYSDVRRMKTAETECVIIPASASSMHLLGNSQLYSRETTSLFASSSTIPKKAKCYFDLLESARWNINEESAPPLLNLAWRGHVYKQT